MTAPRGYRSFQDFEREEIRPEMRIGWSVDELDEPAVEQELDFDVDPFEAALWQAEEEDAAQQQEDEEE
jgi:hypothetical protein